MVFQILGNWIAPTMVSCAHFICNFVYHVLYVLMYVYVYIYKCINHIYTKVLA